MSEKISEPTRLAKLDFAPPPPEPEFRRHVMRCIQEADDFCREQYRLPRRRWGARGLERRPTRRRSDGRCVGCGCLLDERSWGCSNCTARHDMRLYLKVARVCKLIEAAFP